jgi:hypothetical protein
MKTKAVNELPITRPATNAQRVSTDVSPKPREATSKAR